MKITTSQADAIGSALHNAANTIAGHAPGLPQVYVPLRNAAREWNRAATDAEGVQDVAIVLAGMVVAGMQVPGDLRSIDPNDAYTVVRHTNASSLQLEDPNRPQPQYRPYTTLASPIVIITEDPAHA